MIPVVLAIRYDWFNVRFDPAASLVAWALSSSGSMFEFSIRWMAVSYLFSLGLAFFPVLIMAVMYVVAVILAWTAAGERREQRMGWIGYGLLCIGFCLQAVVNVL